MINVIKLILRDESLAEDIELILPLEDNLIRESVDTIQELEVKWKKGIGYQNNFVFKEMELIQVFESEEERIAYINFLPGFFFGDNLIKQTRIANEIMFIKNSDETCICEFLDFYIFDQLADKTIVKSDPWTQEEWVIVTAHPYVTRYWVGDGNNPQSDSFFECSVCNSTIASDNGYMHNYRERVYNNTPIWKTKDYEDEVDYSEDLHYTCAKCKEIEDAKNGMNEGIINGYLRGYFAVSSSLGYEFHNYYYIKEKYPHYSHKRLIDDAKDLNQRFLLMIQYDSLSIAGNEGYITLLKKRKPIEKKPKMEDYGYHSQSGFDDMPSGWMIEGGEEAYYEDVIYYERQQLEKAANEIS